MFIRTFQPNAARATILWGKNADEHPAAQIHPAGFFEAFIPLTASPLSAAPTTAAAVPPESYRLRMATAQNQTSESYDAFAFPPVLTDYDLYLLGEGTHFQNYDKLGAHLREIAGVSGVHFAVWAPNAQRVSVVGDFNHWDGRVHPMRNRPTGIWEIFIPGLAEGSFYKFEILARSGEMMTLKADPYAFAAELRPKSG
ncbi:MAG TPA: hypothetical protein VFU57_08915, partial [Candidatus Acidoferrales bacterium]|nr:hypothetical protein [Candidatus Acidoferrales bacterium]